MPVPIAREDTSSFVDAIESDDQWMPRQVV